ncbi:helix-turn-helix domain-containing protein [Amycolatopsis samaneae]|uniref:Helix-turn-helix transcriptional regulator n=1 Tax=Amycolatopsis samaneae TaxID=664691 RepID=A0ABW5GL65_9PSEU
MDDNGSTTKGLRLGAALREARTSTNESLTQFAKRIRIDKAQISRWETGKMVPSVDKVARLLGALGVGPERYDEIIELAKGAGEEQWLATTLPEQRRQFAAYIDFEARAETITEVAPLLIPGIVQTAGYTRAIMMTSTVPRGEIATRVATRMGRQSVIDHERTEHPARLRVLVGEAALRQIIGDRQVMCEQLQRLRKVAGWGNVDLRVVPFGSGWHPALDGQFSILDPRETTEGFPIVCLDVRRGGLILHTKRDVAVFREAVETVLQVALSAKESSAFLADVIKEMRSG